MGIGFSGPFLNKPLPGCQLNLAHPLAQQLAFAVLFNEGNGNRAGNLVRQVNTASTSDGECAISTTRLWRGSPWGGGLWLNAAGSVGPTWGQESAAINAARNYTVSVVCSFPDVTTGAGSYTQFFGVDSTNNNRFHFQRDGTSVRAGVYISNVQTVATASSVLVKDEPYVLTLVVTTNGTSTFVALYINGCLAASNSVASTQNSDTSVIRSAIGAGCRVLLDGAFFWTFPFANAASPSDALDMVALQAADPFAMFRRQWITTLASSIGAPAGVVGNPFNSPIFSSPIFGGRIAA